MSGIFYLSYVEYNASGSLKELVCDRNLIY